MKLSESDHWVFIYNGLHFRMAAIADLKKQKYDSKSVSFTVIELT